MNFVCSECVDDHQSIKNEVSEEIVANKISTFIRNQISKLQMKCSNSECEWIGSLRNIRKHLKTECKYRLVVCQYCEQRLSFHEWSVIHKDTCSDIPVVCPLKCQTQKLLRKQIAIHIKNECPNFEVGCVNESKGCTFKCARHLMYDKNKPHMCEYRMVECPFAKYGCSVADMPFNELNNHLTTVQVNHLSMKLMNVSQQLLELRIDMKDMMNEQQLKLEFMEKKMKFIHRRKHGISLNANNMHLHPLSNDYCHGLLAFWGSTNGKSPNMNSIDFLNIKQQVKYTLITHGKIKEINKIYNHQYRNLNLEEKEVKIDINTDGNANFNAWDTNGSGFCTASNVQFSCIRPYLVDSVFNSNNTRMSNNVWSGAETVSVVFRCGGKLSLTGEQISRVDGCVIDSSDWFQLPFMKNCSVGCSCVYSHLHGLIVVGGRNDENMDELQTIQRLDMDSGMLWKDLQPMKIKRMYPSMCLWQDMKSDASLNGNESELELLLVCGGLSNGTDLDSCEIYDFASNEWNSISDMNVARSQSTLVHCRMKSKCYNIGGHSESASTTGEEYDLIKDQWLMLNTRMNGKYDAQPMVWIAQQNCIFVADANMCEMYDVRDNKWIIVNHDIQAHFFSNHVYKHKVMRRLVCC